jgi:hypothetical protein
MMAQVKAVMGELLVQDEDKSFQAIQIIVTDEMAKNFNNLDLILLVSRHDFACSSANNVVMLLTTVCPLALVPNSNLVGIPVVTESSVVIPFVHTVDGTSCLSVLLLVSFLQNRCTDTAAAHYLTIIPCTIL